MEHMTTTGTDARTFRYISEQEKTKIVRTYCAFRLGDNLHHLHFMRALAKRNPDVHFQHAAMGQYLPQMIEVVADLPNLSLRDIFSCKGEEGTNAWKNTAGFWETHQKKNDYAEFMLEWFALLAGRLGFESPFSTPADLLFDYPALTQDRAKLSGLTLHPNTLKFVPFDFLVVNSQAMSNQWQSRDECDLNTLIQDLSQRYDVVTTKQTGLSVLATENIPGFTVSDIGALSIYAKRIIQVATGPSWPTLNIWNRDKFRIVLIDHETLGMTENTHQCRTAKDARRVLKAEGLL